MFLGLKVGGLCGVAKKGRRLSAATKAKISRGVKRAARKHR